MTDDFEDELDDREDPDPQEANWNPAPIVCPYCGGDITEDTVSCPHCGNYISAEDKPYDKPIWMVAGIIFLVILIVVGWLWLR
jgi:predicted nucleic acid-binding Zn ribbon protein